MGARWTAIRTAAGLRALQPHQLRVQMAYADAGGARRTGLPHPLRSGYRGLHRITATRDRKPAVDIPQRESLGVAARGFAAVVSDRNRVAQRAPEEVSSAWSHSL